MFTPIDVQEEKLDSIVRSEQAKKIVEITKNFDFKKEINRSDDFRSSLASPKGGFELRD